MKIGIDIDGVILDSERWFKFYSDYIAYFTFKKKKLRNDTLMIEKNYDLTQEQVDKFYDTYFDPVTKDCDFIPGAVDIIKLLKAEGHELYVITMRGFYNENEIKFAKHRLDEIGVEFSGIEWNCPDKSIACHKFGIDFMIEDNPMHIQKIIGGKTKCIQFFAENIKPIRSKYIYYADNWMDAYKIIKDYESK